jgi:hypothetical protein
MDLIEEALPSISRLPTDDEIHTALRKLEAEGKIRGLVIGPHKIQCEVLAPTALQ